MAPVKTIPTGLYWQEKKTDVKRLAPPFQAIEMINETQDRRN